MGRMTGASTTTSGVTGRNTGGSPPRGGGEAPENPTPNPLGEGSRPPRVPRGGGRPPSGEEPPEVPLPGEP